MEQCRECCEFIWKLDYHVRGGTVGVVRRSRSWGWWRSGLIQLGWLMIVHVGLVGAVDGDWFVADAGEACTCIVDGGAGEGIGGA